MAEPGKHKRVSGLAPASHPQEQWLENPLARCFHGCQFLTSSHNVFGLGKPGKGKTSTFLFGDHPGFKKKKHRFWGLRCLQREGGVGPELLPTPCSDKALELRTLAGLRFLTRGLLQNVRECFGSRPKTLWKVQTPCQSAVGEGGFLELRTLRGFKVLIARGFARNRREFGKSFEGIVEGSSTNKRFVEGSNTKRIRADRGVEGCYFGG